MENQHRKITGYRDLSEDEVALLNKVKALGEQVKDLVKELESRPDLDQRSVAIAKTNLQTGFMWAVRSIAQPNSF